MTSRTQIFTVIIAVALLIMGVSAYLFLRQPSIPSRSLLLYTNYESRKKITNWIIDTDTKEKWEVGKGLVAGKWSPAGKYLFFYKFAPLPQEIWVSNFDGGNLHQILDSKNYPDLQIKDFAWLSDKTIIVNVFNTKDEHAYIYLLDIDSLEFVVQNAGRFMRVSPNGKFWVQWTSQNKYHVMDLDKNLALLSLVTSDFYFFSPNGNQWAYSCNIKEHSSSICVADISMNGVANEHTIANVETDIRTSDMWWSQDGKYIGIQTYNLSTSETSFRTVNVSNGTTFCEWKFPTKTTRNFWSPRDDKIIDWDGLMLDLKTGKVSDFFAEIKEATPSYIVDWRLIETP